MLLVFNNLLAYLYVKNYFSLAYPFLVCVVFSSGVFLFTMITNVGVNRWGDSWWSSRWWRWCCL